MEPLKGYDNRTKCLAGDGTKNAFAFCIHPINFAFVHKTFEKYLNDLDYLIFVTCVLLWV